MCLKDIDCDLDSRKKKRSSSPMYGEQKTWHYSNQRKARVELPGEGNVVVNRTYKVKPPLNKQLLEESVSLFRE